ncbi:MAG: OB-fold nucleic acid binding domain-containing protein, partial [Candidatus Micrarchaeota archaeon]
MKTQWAKDLRAGLRVDSNFMVMEKELRPFKTKPGNYLQLKLGDRTGTLRAKCWENVEEVGSRFSPGDVVRVRGTVEE